MHAKIYSATTSGIHGHLVEVEADLSFGLVNMFIVGLPDKAIKESKERIRAALRNSGLRLPDRLITVNLAPASLRKQDVLFDVPIALAILQAAGLLTVVKTFLEETVFLGELSLNGTIKPVCGVLSITHQAYQQGKKRIVVPQSNTAEATLIKGIEVIGVTSLVQLVSYLRAEISVAPCISRFDEYVVHNSQHPLDFNSVKGQRHAKRALQIAAAGNHNLLFIGPPGSGKTMLAQRLPSILPPMTFDEIIQTTKVYSVAGILKNSELIVHRPFRSPHHTISQAGLVGGGSLPRPGEISLAHNGVLFLDELTEFKRSTLEVLRQPLEHKTILISRATTSLEFPASFLLVAALNPCQCGYYGDAKKKCICTHRQRVAYMAKLSGPLLDRIDLHVSVSSLNYNEVKGYAGERISSAELRDGIEKAITMQQVRSGDVRNGLLSGQDVEKYCTMTDEADSLIKKAFTTWTLSMRGFHKILKIARTIADLDQQEIVAAHHVKEALMYRSLDVL